MKKLIIFAFVVLFSLALAVGSVSAEGDKVRGDDSAGPSNQNGDCPFNG